MVSQGERIKPIMASLSNHVPPNPRFYASFRPDSPSQYSNTPTLQNFVVILFEPLLESQRTQEGHERSQNTERQHLRPKDVQAIRL